ncbi:MAG: hypothetical protein FJZ96_04500 [Chloroflexi bacterium]|nr:hypothetical protein [Chloroflexota bacterium]
MMDKRIILIILFMFLLSGCSAPTTPPAPPALTPAPALPDISIIAGMGAAAQTTEWELPSAEQARAGGGGSVPEGISIQMGIFEDQARLRMPASYTFHTAWNGASYENTGRDDLTRFATYSRNNNGEIVWSQINGGPGFNEYPIDWVYVNGVLQVRLEQEFGVIPDSKEAAVIFTGDASGPDDALTFGEKAAIVKNVATLADGAQYYLEYFDFQKGEWAVNTNVLAALLPEANQSNLIWQDEDGQWLAGQAGTEKALLQFDLETKQWVAIPRLSAEEVAVMESTAFAQVDPDDLPAEFRRLGQDWTEGIDAETGGKVWTSEGTQARLVAYDFFDEGVTERVMIEQRIGRLTALFAPDYNGFYDFSRITGQEAEQFVQDYTERVLYAAAKERLENNGNLVVVNATLGDWDTDSSELKIDGQTIVVMGISDTPLRLLTAWLPEKNNDVICMIFSPEHAGLWEFPQKYHGALIAQALAQGVADPYKSFEENLRPTAEAMDWSLAELARIGLRFVAAEK